jgi:hypothetical protein
MIMRGVAEMAETEHFEVARILDDRGTLLTRAIVELTRRQTGADRPDEWDGVIHARVDEEQLMIGLLMGKGRAVVERTSIDLNRTHIRGLGPPPF